MDLTATLLEFVGNRVELICAVVSGLVGAMVAIVNNNKKETFLEGLLNVIVGMIVAAGAGTKFGGEEPAMVCVIGLFAGSVGGLALDAVARLAPSAVWSLIAGNIEKFGGKPLEREDYETRKEGSRADQDV